MKKSRSVDKAIGSGKPIHGIARSPQPENKLPVESDLSPERILDGASATTAVLSQILAQREALHQPRDLGLNE
jgi:hypothetical protein